MKIQQKATTWIPEIFYTSLLFHIKAIASLIPIYLYLQKLSSRLQLRTQSLLSNYIIKSLLELRHSNINNNNYCLSLKKLTSKHHLNTKDTIIDINNKLNRIFPSLILSVLNFLLCLD